MTQGLELAELVRLAPVEICPHWRLAGEPLAYSLSPYQGRDERSVTAVLRALSRLSHDRATGASAAIVEVDPPPGAGEEGVEHLGHLIRGAIDVGVGQLHRITSSRLPGIRTDCGQCGREPFPFRRTSHGNSLWRRTRLVL